MATPPRIHNTELHAALLRIAERRANSDDEEFGYIDSESAAQVLSYLIDHPFRRHPGLARADVEDGLVLWIWLWWQLQRDLHRLLLYGKAVDMPLERMGMPLGLGRRTTSGTADDRKRRVTRNRRQGTQRRIDRLQALLDYDRPDADLTQAARQVASRNRGAGDELVAWLVRHHDTVVAVAEHLLSLRSLVEGDDYLMGWWHEIHRDLREGELSSGSLPIMRLFAGGVRANPAWEDLPEVRRARREVDILSAAAADFSEPVLMEEGGEGRER